MSASARVRRWLAARAGAAGHRLRISLWSILQMALGAGISWQVATTLLDHPYPFFASVAAVISLGLATTKRLRRVAELAVGVSVGVAIGEFVVSLIGRGGWQIALVVALALVIARLLDSGSLIATQAALQSVLVLAIPAPEGGSIARWEDALVGGGVALAIAVVAPHDGRRHADEESRASVDALVDILDGAAHAVRSRDPQTADELLDRARATQPVLDAWDEAVQAAEDVSRLSPLRRGQREELVRHRRALVGVDRATRNARVLVRRISASAADGREVPMVVADLLDELVAVLAVSGGRIATDPPPEFEAALRRVAARLDVTAAAGGTWAGTIAVAQLRSIVVDLLSATGVSIQDARAALPSPGPI